MHADPRLFAVDEAELIEAELLYAQMQVASLLVMRPVRDQECLSGPVREDRWSGQAGLPFALSAPWHVGGSALFRFRF